MTKNYYYSEKTDSIIYYMSSDSPQSKSLFFLNLRINGKLISDWTLIEKDLELLEFNSDSIKYKDLLYEVKVFHDEKMPYTLYERK